ncbi:MAG: histidinol dehydrogenase [Gaiellaceae bacterium]
MRTQGYDDIWPQVAEIVGDVRARGDAALLEWTERLDGVRLDSPRVSAAELAAGELDAEALDALLRLATAVELFHAPQRPPDVRVSPYPGIETERRFVPLDSVGIYAPGGLAAYPSTLAMTVVPAHVAGVRRVAVATPRPSPGMLAAARELGVDEVYAIGGAQAVGALAFGTETVAPVDKIVGPGNRWVTAAKLLVSAHVGIDLPAGPTEVVIVADETADPRLAAADLAAQLEHGPDGAALLITTSAEFAAAVGSLCPEADVKVVASLEEAIDAANEFAPEHLQLHVADPEALAERVTSAGAVFLGEQTSSVLGDYAVGTNHVLPTGGLARSSGGLGLETFMKPLQLIRATPEGVAAAAEIVGPLARVEGLPLHAAAVEARL